MNLDPEASWVGVLVGLGVGAAGFCRSGNGPGRTPASAYADADENGKRRLKPAEGSR